MKKLQLVYKPYVIITIANIVGYTFLHWLLIIQFQLFSIPTELILFLFPCSLFWIPYIIWLQPRLKLLDIYSKNKKANRVGLYILLAYLSSLTPTVISQLYLSEITGKLTSLENINQINTTEITKYYTLNTYYINKNQRTTAVKTSWTGKKEDDYKVKVYIVAPFYLSKEDTTNSIAWFGFTDYTSFLNKNDENKSKTAYFKKYCQQTFDTINCNKITYFTSLENSADQDGFYNAINGNRQIKSHSKIVLIPSFEPFENRSKYRLFWILLSLIIGASIWLFALRFANFAINTPRKSTVENIIKK